ncbi:Threonine dehydrogenase [Rhodoblastus acidophilus]|uniref:Threonine dehydrogenase n=1 Tax=Rhodoblastus acidophilus TaxID=1074 RepID=A0A212RHY9_RHOAC|nr:zinc-binding alcohol dehydrogenase [Rhodoblastus acidophilus]SNB71842.1 Threonine dehydrogenase [Rhodoblastus acidophilus]
MVAETAVKSRSSLFARALWQEERGRLALRQEALTAPTEAEALVKTLWSAVSRGTERLVFDGRVPASQYAVMRAPMQRGEFPFPVQYGYAAVGRVEAGPVDWLGATVFCLHPHQDRFVAPLDALRRTPAGLPARRATLAANMETALNALWDSGAGPGDRIVIIGAGVVGLLTAALAARLPGAEVCVVDPDGARAGVAQRFGADYRAPAACAAFAGTADCVFHASGAAEGLALALDCAGLEATIIEMSWYGDSAVPAPLGEAFHSRRLRLVSSQVGHVAPSRRPRWSAARRLDKALTLLCDARFDELISEEVDFTDAPAAAPRLFGRGAPGLATVLRYSDP